jgi:hypothetical protein
LKNLSYIVSFVAIQTLTGCASFVEGTTQSIAITTAPVDGAKCTLISSEGAYYVTTPGNAIVHKTKTDLDVSCTKDGFLDAYAKISPHFNGTTVGNVLVGGLIGIAVDASTGANYNYPSSTIVPLLPIGSILPDAVEVPAPPMQILPTS